MTIVPPHALKETLAYIRAGHIAYVPSYTCCITIDAKCLAKWEAAGRPLLREEGDGYRLAQGKSSVYLLPGQLRIE